MKRLLAGLFVVLMLMSVAFSQDHFIPDQEEKPKTDTKQDDEKKKQEEQEKKDEEEKIKKYEELLKDTTKAEGPFTFYLKKKDVYVELDPSQLNKTWFIQGAFSTGAAPFVLTSGFPIGRDFQAVDAFRFERREEDIWLWVPNLNWRWKSHDPYAKAAERSFPEGVLASYKIEAEHPKTKKMLVKITEMFYGDLFDMNTLVMASMMKPFQLDRNKTRVYEIKGYPENMLVRVEMFYSSQRSPMGGGLSELVDLLGLGGKSHLADDRSLVFSVNYLIYPEKESDYVPRVADPRVGYFTNSFFDHSKFMQLDRMTHFINRWNIKKKDPNAEMSEPVKPLVWYIDDSVPERWKKACAEGILRWNKAFENIGIKNAIVVKYKTPEDDWGHADMRYNVLRFTSSENAGYAVALFRTNPFTGEIVNASINVDANMVMYVGQEFIWRTQPATTSWTGALEQLTTLSPNLSEIWPILSEKRGKHWTDHTCSIGEGKLNSATFGWKALEVLHESNIKLTRDEYIEQFVADVIAHEMGHCLGLRHNFVASTELTLEELKDTSKTEKYGTSSSVMDYVPVNIGAVLEGDGHFYSPTIGTYDMFAIEYGYSDFGNRAPESDLPHLRRIASKNSLPGHAYMTDENADSFDPYVVRFDLSKNPLDAMKANVAVSKKLLEVADYRYPAMGRPYSDLARAVRMSLMSTMTECMNAARFVGGAHGRRNFRGDPDEKPTMEPVDPEKQRTAIQMIAREMLSENSFRLSERMLLNLSPNYESEPYNPANIKDTIAMLQRSVIANLLSANTVAMVNNNAYKLRYRSNVFTLSELYETIVNSVFEEVGTGRAVGVLRRDLQRLTLEALITQALSRPGALQEDARVLAMYHINELHKKLKSATSGDAMTKIHLSDLASRIERAQKSILTISR